MFKLMRKEARQLFPSWAIAVLAGAIVFFLFRPEAKSGYTSLIFLGFFAFFAVLLGAQGFALERDQRTLGNLVRLPVSRRTLWVAKLLTGLIALLIGAGLILLTGVILTRGSLSPLYRMIFFPLIGFLVLPYLLAFFFSTTPLSTIHAAVLAFLICAGLWTLTPALFDMFKPYRTHIPILGGSGILFPLICSGILVAALLWGVNRIVCRPGFH